MITKHFTSATIMEKKKLNLLLLATSLVMAGMSSADTVTFESGQGYAAANIGPTNSGTVTPLASDAPFTGQQGWSLSTSGAPGTIITTSNSGEYVGGQALSTIPLAGQTVGTSNTYIGGKLGNISPASTNSISFDLRFFIGNNIVTGFLGDSDNDGLFDNTGDTGMQFGVSAGNVFVREKGFGSNTTLTGMTGALTAGKWYRFNVTIGEIIGSDRSITISVRNLTDAATVDLNGASDGTDYTFLAADSAFGAAPEDAVGGFVRVTQTSTVATTRSVIDNMTFTAISTSPPTLANFTYDASTGSSEVSIKGNPSTAYIVVEADDLDFTNPDQSPVPLTGATVGTLTGNQVTTDTNGDATVQFDLGTTKPATFVRAQTP